MKFKRNFSVILLALWTIAFTLSFNSVAQAQEPPSRENKIPVEVGAYIIDVYDVNFVENQVSVEFYIWFRFEKEAALEGFTPLESFFVVNAQEMDLEEPVTYEVGNTFYQIGRVKAVMKKNWNVADYPFDEHVIEILIEDGSDQWQIMEYIPDNQDSEIDPDLKMTSWILQDLYLNSVEKVWTSNFGDPSLESENTTSFKRVGIEFHMVRPSGGFLLFIKAFSGVFVAVIVAFISLLVRPDELEVRTGLSVGSLFAAIGNNLVVSSVLPETSEPTFVDYLHNMSYIFIGVTALIAVLSNNWLRRDREDLALKTNLWAQRILPPLYVILVVIMSIFYYTSNLSGG